MFITLLHITHPDCISQATRHLLYERRFKHGINITKAAFTSTQTGLYKSISKHTAREHAGIVNCQSMARQRALSGGECDHGSEVQVLVLAELITKECPYANTELPYYYK